MARRRDGAGERDLRLSPPAPSHCCADLSISSHSKRTLAKAGDACPGGARPSALTSASDEPICSTEECRVQPQLLQPYASSLQPHAIQPATLRNPACNRTQSSLNPMQQSLLQQLSYLELLLPESGLARLMHAYLHVCECQARHAGLQPLPARLDGEELDLPRHPGEHRVGGAPRSQSCLDGRLEDGVRLAPPEACSSR